MRKDQKVRKSKEESNLKNITPEKMINDRKMKNDIENGFCTGEFIFFNFIIRSNN